MRKIIALSTLIVASSAMAQSTSTTKVSNKKLTLKERLSYSWFVEASDTKAGNETLTRDVDLYNSISAIAKINDRVNVVINPTFNIQDANDTGDTNKTDDKFAEGDLRFKINGNLISSSFFTSLTYILPTTQATLDADNSDGQIRLYHGSSKKFDDFNNLTYGVSLRKYLHKNQADVQALYRVLPYLSYTNTKFSEKVAIRADYEGSLWHQAGRSFNSIKESGATGQRMILGANFSNIPGINSVFPYIAHYQGLVKATDQLGIGLQAAKTF